MSVQSGKGGYVVTKPALVGLRVDVSDWTLDIDPRLSEVTTTAPGGTRYAGVVSDPSWSLSMPHDDAAVPQLAGLTEGATLPLVGFKLGSGSKCHTVANTTVGQVGYVNDAKGDVVRFRVSGKGGDVTKDTTLIALV